MSSTSSINIPTIVAPSSLRSTLSHHRKSGSFAEDDQIALLNKIVSPDCSCQFGQSPTALSPPCFECATATPSILYGTSPNSRNSACWGPRLTVDEVAAVMSSFRPSSWINSRPNSFVERPVSRNGGNNESCFGGPRRRPASIAPKSRNNSPSKN